MGIKNMNAAVRADNVMRRVIPVDASAVVPAQPSKGYAGGSGSNDALCADDHMTQGRRINAAPPNAFYGAAADFAALTPLAFVSGMSDIGHVRTAEDIRAWMKEVLAQTGMTPAAWAKRAGVAPSTIQRALKDDYSFVTSSKTLAKLADCVAPSSTVHNSFTKPTTSGRGSLASVLPVRFEVGAGVWRTGAPLNASASAPVAADPEYAGFDQWLERVTTPSAELEYLVGSLVHVVDPAAMGGALRSGDHVVVTIAGPAPDLTERAIMVARPQAVGPVLLHHLSTDPRFAAPVALGDGVELVGLVLGSYRPRRV